MAMRRTRPSCSSSTSATLIALLLAATPAAGSPLGDAVRTCQAIEADDRRLACFDALEPVPDEAPESEAVSERQALAAERAELAAQREALAADRRTDAERTREALENPGRELMIAAFGAENLPEDRRPPIPSKKLDRFEARVAEVSHYRHDQLLIRLDNGQLWRQTDYGNLELEPGDRGQRVILDRGWLGSYWMINADNQLRMRVLRER